MQDEWRRESELGGGGEIEQALYRLRQLTEVGCMKEIAEADRTTERDSEKTNSKNESDERRRERQMAVKKAKTPDLDRSLSKNMKIECSEAE